MVEGDTTGGGVSSTVCVGVPVQFGPFLAAFGGRGEEQGVKDSVAVAPPIV